MSLQVSDNLVKKPSFHAVGLKWSGTFEEAAAGGVKEVHAELKRRLSSIKHIVNASAIYGLSVHEQEDGFDHYAVAEVEAVQEVPEGMVSLEIPTQQYAVFEHRRNTDTMALYREIEAWISEHEFTAPKDFQVTHFEIYPIEQDPYTNEPEFTIMIPVEKVNKRR